MLKGYETILKSSSYIDYCLFTSYEISILLCISKAFIDNIISKGNIIYYLTHNSSYMQ